MLAIVAVLIGLVATAVQRARAAADRAACADRLRQVGLALHGYHDQQRSLPPGFTGRRDRDLPYISWQARVLPHLEADAIWRESVEAYRLDRNFRHTLPHAHRSTVVRALTCPADGDSQAARTLENGQHVAFTDYLGVEGTDQQKRDGLLYLDSRVRLTDVADGTSTTLLAGERPPGADGLFGWWYAGGGQDRDGSAEMVLGVLERAVSFPCPGSSGLQPDQGTACDYLHFWSHHSGGAHFLFADGGVRFLTYNANPLLPALATRAGGEAVAEP